MSKYDESPKKVEKGFPPKSQNKSVDSIVSERGKVTRAATVCTSQRPRVLPPKGAHPKRQEIRKRELVFAPTARSRSNRPGAILCATKRSACPLSSPLLELSGARDMRQGLHEIQLVVYLAHLRFGQLRVNPMHATAG